MKNAKEKNIDMETMDAIKHNIVHFRKKRGLTQTELGLKIGLSKRAIAYYEREAKNISWDALETVAKALEVPLQKLLNLKGGTQEETPLPRTLQKRIEKLHTLSPKGQKQVQEYIDMVAKAEDT